MGVYAPQDYVVYIGILILVLWLLKNYFFRYVNLDKGFIYAISPYMLVGIFIRLLADVGVFEKSKLWNITPGVYLLTCGIVLFFICLGLLASKRYNIEYWKIPLAAGILILLPLTYMLFSNLTHPVRILYPLVMAAGITGAICLLAAVFKLADYRRPENLGIIFSHLLDGCATFIAYNYYGFYEEHLLPIFLIGSAGNNAFVMVPVKLILILVVIYYVEKWHREDLEKDEFTYRAMKLLLFILGIGPGIRDMMLPALIP